MRLRLSAWCAGLAAFVLMSAAMSNAAIDPRTVIGAWLFDEAEGDEAMDSTANGRDGEHTGNPEIVEGVFGRALALDGDGGWAYDEDSGLFQADDGDAATDPL